MDPPLIGEGSFSATNPSLSEIWPFNGGGDLGLRMGSGGFTSGFIDHLLNNNGGDGGGGGGSGGGCGGGGGSLEESSVTEQSRSLGVGGGVNGRKRKEDHFSKVDSITSSCGIDLKEPLGKRVKTSTSREDNGSSKAKNPGDKLAEPLKDYIHVRARRGQATDSHSLAERARREKISERMKMLQDLVPGTNKVIGKALVLDEIINYIQSLQRQVEFLSMKLEAVNSTMIPSISGFHSKDVNQLGMPSFDPSGMMFSAQAARELATASEGQHAEWLHMQLGGNFERTS